MARPLLPRIIGTIAVVATPALLIWLNRFDFVPVPGSDVGGPPAIIAIAGIVGFVLGALWRSSWPFAVIFAVWIGYSVVVLAASDDTGRTDPEVGVVIAGLFGFIPAMIGALMGALTGIVIDRREGARRSIPKWQRKQ